MTGVLLVLLVTAGGCERLHPPADAPGLTGREALATVNAVPAAYGRLVGVTTTEGYRESFAQLWFEEERTGTIRVVYYHFRDRRLDPKVDVIRRGQSPAAMPAAEDSP